jgi:hypothetical protein
MAWSELQGKRERVGREKGNCVDLRWVCEDLTILERGTVLLRTLILIKRHKRSYPATLHNYMTAGNTTTL